jgi:hypothetical protein
MSVAEQLSAKIEALAPGKTKDKAAALAISDIGFAIGARFSQVVGIDVPKDLPERDALYQRSLELLRAWVPLLDAKTLKALEYRVDDRKTPIDLKARKRELRKGRLPDRTKELAPFAELPPLEGFEPLGALYVEETIVVGELGDGHKLDARPGVWLAYGRDFDTIEEEEPQQLVAVHADCFSRIEELRIGMAAIKGELPIHGATMAVADGLAVKKDGEDLRDALSANEEELYRGRAAQMFLGGDGRGEAFVQYEDKLAVLVVVKM